MASQRFYAIVAGAGSGTGRAVAIRFSKAYPVVLMSRKPESYEDIVKDIRQAGGQAFGVATDATDVSSLDSAFEKIQQALPDHKLAAAVYNVNAGFARKPFLEMGLDDLQTGLNGAAGGFFNFGQKTVPLLLDSVASSPSPPTLILTGATASMKASSQFPSFAAGRFAMRALGQSLAREFGPKGVHVAHAVIDGLINTPPSRAWNSGGKPDSKISPESIAETYWYLHTQHRSAFTHEIDIRPYSESF
ncbi:probable short chain dehydrogenase [Fusarium oxysporum]|uniref:Probable short chain dehydrogenase n=1 Tax=Fusarium oxysporum TaxID=5507 RepID=A0A2H3TAJ4_FUSOX|nr:probable short chain dehydrogenase [Fusarium oxysporum]